MVNFIKYSDEKIHGADAKMKAVRNMKDKIDTLKKQREIMIHTINQKSLDCKQREAELKTVHLIHYYILFVFFVVMFFLFFHQVADDIKTGKSELTNIQKHRDELINLLNKAKQEQEEIEKTYSKLCVLKNNVIILFSKIVLNIILFNN